MKFVWQGWVVTKQISEETDVQDVVVQAVPPTSRACALPAPSMPVGVSKPIPKLRPSSVRMLPTVTGRFLGRRNDTTGESKVNAFLIVPTMALTVMTLACVFRMLMPANKKTHVFGYSSFTCFYHPQICSGRECQMTKLSKDTSSNRTARWETGRTCGPWPKHDS